uniref:Uncharacterized protein n=1 Tax=Romanomermis culicivorax TaxID=13658 RepID=A0A915I8Y4_ROMCU
QAYNYFHPPQASLGTQIGQQQASTCHQPWHQIIISRVTSMIISHSQASLQWQLQANFNDYGLKSASKRANPSIGVLALPLLHCLRDCHYPCYTACATVNWIEKQT